MEPSPRIDDHAAAASTGSNLYFPRTINTPVSFPDTDEEGRDPHVDLHLVLASDPFGSASAQLLPGHTLEPSQDGLGAILHDASAVAPDIAPGVELGTPDRALTDREFDHLIFNHPLTEDWFSNRSRNSSREPSFPRSNERQPYGADPATEIVAPVQAGGSTMPGEMQNADGLSTSGSLQTDVEPEPSASPEDENDRPGPSYLPKYTSSFCDEFLEDERYDLGYYLPGI
jgi:hypothetical protein